VSTATMTENCMLYIGAPCEVLLDRNIHEASEHKRGVPVDLQVHK